MRRVARSELVFIWYDRYCRIKARFGSIPSATGAQIDMLASGTTHNRGVGDFGRAEARLVMYGLLGRWVDGSAKGGGLAPLERQILDAYRAPRTHKAGCAFAAGTPWLWKQRAIAEKAALQRKPAPNRCGCGAVSYYYRTVPSSQLSRRKIPGEHAVLPHAEDAEALTVQETIHGEVRVDSARDEQDLAIPGLDLVLGFREERPTHDEIAEMLNVTPSAVRRAVKSAYGQLLDNLRPWQVAEEDDEAHDDDAEHDRRRQEHHSVSRA